MTGPTDYICPAATFTLPDLFAARVERSPNAIAYQWYEPKFRSWQAIGWRESYRRSVDWSNRLLAEGYLHAGDRVAVMLENGAHWVALEHAILRAGLVLVPIHPQTRLSQLKYILNDSGCKLAFVEKGEFVQAVFDEEQLPDLRRVICFSYCDNRSHAVTPFLDWLEEPRSEQVTTPELLADKLAVLAYTSGTCGLPKGVMLSHKALLSNAYAALSRISVTPDDSLFSTQSLADAMERTIILYGAMIAGVRVVFSKPERYFEDLAAMEPSVIVSVPAFYEQLKERICATWENSTVLKRILLKSLIASLPAQHCDEAEMDLRFPGRVAKLISPFGLRKQLQRQLGSKLRLMISGGARLPHSVSGFFNVLQLPLMEGYGLTEAGPVVCISPPQENCSGSAGQALDGVSLTLSDEGELLVKSSSLMLGYWKSEPLHDSDWLATGDRARISDGHVFIQGRLKDELVLSNGQKVNPVLMESVLKENTPYQELYLYEDSRAGLSAIIFVGNDHDVNVLKADMVRSQLNFAMRHLPGGSRVQQVSVMPQSLKHEKHLVTASGKIRRNEIASILSSAPAYNKIA